jgi:ankyrin repeat protein
MRRGVLILATALLSLPLFVSAADSGVEPDGTTPLHRAVYARDLPQVQRLIAAGADVRAVNRFGASALQLAAVTADVPVIAALLKAGADADSTTAEGQTALMTVARTGNVEAATLLLRAGASVNARENWGVQTALFWAAAQSQPDMLKLLLVCRPKELPSQSITTPPLPLNTVLMSSRMTRVRFPVVTEPFDTLG